jgi:hypothetical protein
MRGRARGYTGADGAPLGYNVRLAVIVGALRYQCEGKYGIRW